MIGHVAIVLLRLDDGVEIAAIGDVDLDLAEHRAVDRQPFGIEEGRHVGDAHFLDILADLPVFGDHQPGRRVEPSTPGVFGFTSPCSIAIVTVPIVPWPHIGRQPEVSMNRMAMSQSGRVGG